MAIKVRQKSVDYIKNLISRGRVDLESSWEFEASDENKLIEEKGWDVFMNVHIAYDDEGVRTRKAHTNSLLQSSKATRSRCLGTV